MRNTMKLTINTTITVITYTEEKEEEKKCGISIETNQYQ